MSSLGTKFLFLNGVKSSAVADKIKSGYFYNLELSDIPKVNTNSNKVKVLGICSDESAPVFSFKSKSGREVIVTTTNCSENQPRNCLWCYKILDKNALVIPERIDIQDNITYYIGSKKCCNFNCGLAEVLRRNPRGSRSERLINELFDFCHPGKVLKPAEDPTLLKIFGGPLDYDEYEKNIGRYIKVDGVRIVECREYYHSDSLKF